MCAMTLPVIAIQPRISKARGMDDIQIRMVGLYASVEHRNVYINSLIHPVDVGQREIGDPHPDHATGNDLSAGIESAVSPYRHHATILLKRIHLPGGHSCGESFERVAIH